MNAPRLILPVLCFLLCMAAIWVLSSPPSLAQQGQPPAEKRCVGIATAILRTENPVITRVYRVFEDGTVETIDDGAPGARWTPIGR
jgi:hypothetical protein